MSQIDFNPAIEGSLFEPFVTELTPTDILNISTNPVVLIPGIPGVSILIAGLWWYGIFNSIPYGGVGALRYEIRNPSAPNGAASQYYKSLDAWTFTADLRYKIEQNSGVQTVQNGDYNVIGEPLIITAAANPTGGNSSITIVALAAYAPY